MCQHMRSMHYGLCSQLGTPALRRFQIIQMLISLWPDPNTLPGNRANCVCEAHFGLPFLTIFRWQWYGLLCSNCESMCSIFLSKHPVCHAHIWPFWQPCVFRHQETKPALAIPQWVDSFLFKIIDVFECWLFFWCC